MSLHNLGYLILSMFYLIVIIATNNIYMDILVITLTIFNLIIFGKINYKLLLMMLIFLIPISLSFYVAGIFFVKVNALEVTEVLIIRTLALSISGVLFMVAIDFEELILYFMQKLKLPTIMGYPLLSAVNAFRNLKDEYFRINNAYLMRYGKRAITIKIIFPMLLSATRYAFHNGLSMECRGLNKNKTFIHQVTAWHLKDSIIITFNILVVVVVYLCLRHNFL